MKVSKKRMFLNKKGGDKMGARKGSNNGGGRKPKSAIALDVKITHQSNDAIERRREVEKGLTCEANEINNPPSGLSTAARNEWRRIIGLFDTLELRILCDLDLQILKEYCEMFAEYKDISAIIKKVKSDCKKNGELFRYKMVEDEVKQRNNIIKLINQLADQLLISPQARARMGILKAQDNPELDSDTDNVNSFFDELEN